MSNLDHVRLLLAKVLHALLMALSYEHACKQQSGTRRSRHPATNAPRICACSLTRSSSTLTNCCQRASSLLLRSKMGWISSSDRCCSKRSGGGTQDVERSSLL